MRLLTKVLAAIRRCLLLAVATSIMLTHPAILAAAPDGSAPMRVFLVDDDSGSMTRGNRFAFSRASLRRWAESFEPENKTTVELLRASDHISAVGAYAIDQDEGLAALTRALDELKPKRYSRTVFRTIDAELAEYVASHARPDEEVVIAIISDGISDEPAKDLSLLDLGDQMVAVGGGVFAAVSAHFPAVEALVVSDSALDRARRAAPTRPKSRLRRLLPTNIAFSPRASTINRTLVAKFIRGYESTTISLAISNEGTLPRLLRLHAEGPEGAVVGVEPATVVLESHGRAAVSVAVSASKPVDGAIVVTAEAPDGTSARSAIEATISLDPWSPARVWALVLISAGMLAVVFVAWVLGRRGMAIAPAGQSDPVVELRRGDVVPITTFSRDFPAGVSVGRGWLGFYVATSGVPVRLGGVPIRGGKARYPLRTDIEAGEATVILDRFNEDNHLSAMPFSTGPTGSTDGLL